MPRDIVFLRNISINTLHKGDDDDDDDDDDDNNNNNNNKKKKKKKKKKKFLQYVDTYLPNYTTSHSEDNILQCDVQAITRVLTGNRWCM